MALGPPILYFVFIWWKASLNVYDSVILLGFHLVYLYIFNKIPPQSEEGIEDLERIPRAILALRVAQRNATIGGLFLAGGAILYFVAHPFLETMLAVAVSLGVSDFLFVQWVGAFPLRISGKGERPLLDTEDQDCTHGTDEHGLIQRKSMDRTSGYVAYCLWDKPGRLPRLYSTITREPKSC
jgi:hypothetical protein